MLLLVGIWLVMLLLTKVRSPPYSEMIFHGQCMISFQLPCGRWQNLLEILVGLAGMMLVVLLTFRRLLRRYLALIICKSSIFIHSLRKRWARSFLFLPYFTLACLLRIFLDNNPHSSVSFCCSCHLILFYLSFWSLILSSDDWVALKVPKYFCTSSSKIAVKCSFIWTPRLWKDTHRWCYCSCLFIKIHISERTWAVE